MQVATTPFAASLSHPHYHAYYQIHTPGPHDHELKRQYLALLPPQQIIELCMTFDLHAPPYVKSSIWPPDLNAAIAALKPPPPPTPVAQPAAEEKTAEETPKEPEPVMDSLKSPAPPAASPARPPEEPQPPAPPDPAPEASTSTTEASSAASSAPTENVPPPPTDSAEPAAAATTAPTPAPATPNPPPTPATPAPQPPASMAPPAAPAHYPHQPYAYAHPHAAYPHTPYYSTHPGGYSYPYASYPAPMQNGYHQQPAATYPPQPTMYSSVMPMAHQPQHEGAASGEDLPSYEEMIVEALTGCGDAEGWAPKDLFAWMASRYPLQSNFRPSASQALQKAFKRGRFEKSSNGKYRLNATWNGGNTSRRTTRRPQTQSSATAPGNSTPAPPFTNAPLVHHHAPTAPGASGAAQPAYSQPFGYGYGQPGYTPYGAQPQASTSTAPGTLASAAADTSAADATKTAAATTSDDNTAAAYEAAQNILNAINFGSLYQLSSEDQAAKDAQPEKATSGTTGVEELLSHLSQAMAQQQGDGNSNNAHQPHPAAVPPAPPPDPVVADPRAELQAQLALLAAQFAELAKVEETESVSAAVAVPVPVPTPAAPAPVQIAHPQPVLGVQQTPAVAPLMRSLQPPPPSTAVVASAPVEQPTAAAAEDVDADGELDDGHTPAELDFSHLPDPLSDDEDDSDDDDMEEVI